MNDLPRSRREAEPSPEPLNLNSEHAPVGQMACPELPHMAPIRALTCSEAHGREGEGASGATGTVLLTHHSSTGPPPRQRGGLGTSWGKGEGRRWQGGRGRGRVPGGHSLTWPCCCCSRNSDHPLFSPFSCVPSRPWQGKVDPRVWSPEVLSGVTDPQTGAQVWLTTPGQAWETAEGFPWRLKAHKTLFSY